MLNIIDKTIYIIILIISATFFIYYINKYANTDKLNDLLLCILYTVLLLFSAHKLFQDKLKLTIASIYIKVIPLILLFIIDILQGGKFKNKIIFYKITGIVFIINGIFLMQIQ